VPAMHEGKSIPTITNGDLRSIDQREAAEAMRAKCEAIARERETSWAFDAKTAKHIADAIAALKGEHSTTASYTPLTEADLLNEIALMFFDAMTVKCVPSDYAKCVIKKVRDFDLVQHARFGRI
jgi:hypothetical protein